MHRPVDELDHTPDLITDRLVLRSWSPDEAAAVVDGTRRERWADDVPTAQYRATRE